jgi:hypothetical protein
MTGATAQPAHQPVVPIFIDLLEYLQIIAVISDNRVWRIAGVDHGQHRRMPCLPVVGGRPLRQAHAARRPRRSGQKIARADIPGRGIRCLGILAERIDIGRAVRGGFGIARRGICVPGQDR